MEWETYKNWNQNKWQKGCKIDGMGNLYMSIWEVAQDRDSGRELPKPFYVANVILQNGINEEFLYQSKKKIKTVDEAKVECEKQFRNVIEKKIDEIETGLEKLKAMVL